MSILAVVKLKSATGFSQNDVVNTFAFDGADSPEARAAIKTDIIDFYNGVHAPSTEALAAYLSPYLSRASNVSQLDFYDIQGALDGSPHGSPVELNSWTLGPLHSGYDAYAEEVACVLSLKGDTTDVPEEGAGLVEIPSDARAIAQGAPATHLGRTRPRSRRRGRLYIGPLANGGVDTDDASSRVRVDPNLRDILGRAGAALRTRPDGPTLGGNWCVWSRRDAALHDIVSVSVDDALDTQRRRGVKAVTRTTF